MTTKILETENIDVLETRVANVYDLVRGSVKVEIDPVHGVVARIQFGPVPMTRDAQCDAADYAHECTRDLRRVVRAMPEVLAELRQLRAENEELRARSGEAYRRLTRAMESFPSYRESLVNDAILFLGGKVDTETAVEVAGEAKCAG